MQIAREEGWDDSTPSIHLIIQGPMISVSPKDETGTPFRAEDNVIDIVQRYHTQFASITVVTWKSESTEKLEDAIRQFDDNFCRVVKLDDPGKGRDFFGDLLDNRLRQYTSTAAGLQSIASLFNGTPLVMKVRTDQHFELLAMKSELLSMYEGRTIETRVVFPYANAMDLYSVNDFYIAGRLDVLSDYFAYLISSLKTPVGSRSVHVDLAQKYLILRGALRTGRFTSAGPKRRHFYSISTPFVEYRHWSNFLCSDFLLFSRHLFESGTWRGEVTPKCSFYIFGDDLKLGGDHILLKLTKFTRRKIDRRKGRCAFPFYSLPRRDRMVDRLYIRFMYAVNKLFV